MRKLLITLATVALAAVVLVVPASAATTLTASDEADLRYMREEEKLARDVYTVLAMKWTDAILFARIAQSEQRHMDAVKVVLDRYGVTDPAAATKPGEFTNAELQKLYDELVAEGSASLEAALAVGVQIEEVDIADLEKALAETSNTDLERVYGNLLRGSKNHLQAFTASTDGKVPVQRGQGRRPGGQGSGQGSGQGRGPGAGQGQGLRDGSCTGDGQQARRGPGGGRGW